MSYRRPPVGDLTARNLDVLRLAADGLTYAHIARRLDVSHSTVRYHVTQAMGRLGARNIGHAVAIAYRTGQLGDLEEPTVTDEPSYDKYPGGECFCGGCNGMGPCDDDLGVTDEDDWDDDTDTDAECPCGKGCWDDDFDDDCSRVAYPPIVTVDTGGLP